MNPFRSKELSPLENPVVLGLVFEYCNFEDLKICRQVSKVWRDSSLKTWRSSAVVVIGTWGEKGNNMPNMSEFLELVQNENSNFPGSPFVTSYVINENSQVFWNICGSSVKTLTLRGIEFQSKDVLRNVIFEWCPNLNHLALALYRNVKLPGVTKEPTELPQLQFGEQRKLESLTLEYTPEETYESYPVSWMELLCYFPSLETLKIDGHLPNCGGLFKSLNLIRERDPRKLMLKHVGVTNYYFSQFPASLFLALQDSRLQLSHLELGYVSPENAIQVQEILRIHASTLKKVSLRGEDELVDLIDCFPTSSRTELVNLEELSLDFSEITIECFKFTPNIRKLELDFCRILNGRTHGPEIAGFSLVRCTELEIVESYDLGERFNENLRSLSKLLPHLEKLTIPSLGNIGFATLCENCSNLVSLTVVGSYVDDCGVTGLDWMDVDRINEEGETGTWKPITVPRANITALKRLQTFHLTASHTGHELGVASALCGILQLPQLRHLKIEHYAPGTYRLEPQNPTLWKTFHDRWP